MKIRHSWIGAVLGAVVIGMLAVGNLRAAPGVETQPPALLQNHPLLDCFLSNLGKMAELRRGLGLTDEQRQKIAEIFQGRKSETLQIVRKLRGERKKVLAAVRAQKPEEAAIRAAVADMAKIWADAAVLRSQIRQQVLPVLTSKQRGQVDKFLAEVQSSADQAFAEFEAK